MDEGLRILAEVKRQIGVPVLTDVHAEARRSPRSRRSSTCCRRRRSCAGRPTSSSAVARAGKPVNIKKGQFLAPEDMKHVVAQGAGRDRRRQHHGLRARRVVRLPQPRLRHALARDHARAPAARSCSTPRIRCSCRAARARRAAASASSCRCWRAPRSPRASRACSWKRIRIRPRRCPTGRTRGRSARMRALLETLVELDATVKRAGFPENELMASRDRVPMPHSRGST